MEFALLAVSTNERAQTMEWETENLKGRVDFRAPDGLSIYSKQFEIPSSHAVGKYAKYNILHAAGVHPYAKCVRHFMSYPIVWARLIPSEHLIFQ